MKKIVKTQIISTDSNNQYKSKVIMDNNTLKYKEDDVIVVLKKYPDYITLNRRTNDYNYTFMFKKGESKLEYSLTQNNFKFNLDFNTNDLIINENRIFISYNLENIDYTYEVLLEEDL